MTFQEITSRLQDKPSNLITVEAGKHYNWIVGSVHFLPTTKAQIKRQLQGITRNLLMCGQWYGVEKFLNEYGFKGEYKLTRSKTMCRLVNLDDYKSALRCKLNNI